MNRKKLWNWLCSVLLSTLLIMTVSVLVEGMWLWGVPSIEDVESVQVIDLRYSPDPKEFADADKIELAVKLSGFLKYRPLTASQTDLEPIVTITYILKDGSSKSLSANENTVWWKGKTRALKQEEIFLNLCEGIFFFGEAVEAEL